MMKIKPTLKLIAALLLLIALNSQLSACFAQVTTFTYQGRLNDGANPANGKYDFQPLLYTNVSSGPALIPTPPPILGVGVTNGLFTILVTVSPPNPFNGQALWLELNVRTNGAATYTNLAPRQALTPTPYAAYAVNAGSASNYTGSVIDSQLSANIPRLNASDTFSSGVTALWFAGDGSALTNLNASQLASGTVPDARLSANVALRNGTNTFTATNVFNGVVLATNAGNQFSGNGAGLTNVNATSVGGLPGSIFWRLDGNNVLAGQFLGSTNNQPVEIKVNNQRVLRLEPTVTSAPNIIGGSWANYVQAGVFGATIAGGGWTNVLFTNSVRANFGTVGGGFGNTNSGYAATISGGRFNACSNFDATVGGGYGNTSSAEGATVGGGTGNTVSEGSSTISGGYFNTASGGGATVGGGDANTSSGDGATIGGGGGNLTSQEGATIAGGYANISSGYTAFIGGGDLNTNGGDYATLGGGIFNTVSTNFATLGGGLRNANLGQYGFVGGGDSNICSGTAAVIAGGDGNKNSGNWATVVGGYRNTNSGPYATIGGGFYNTSSGYYSTLGGGELNTSGIGQMTTVGGGYGNTSSGDSSTVSGGWSNTSSDYAAVVGGGFQNTASGMDATVGGGSYNVSSNLCATVPGGLNNVAGGKFSLAAGLQAKALHNGTFVWADANFADFATTSSNQFLIRAAGGVGIGTNAPMMQLHVQGDERLTGVLRSGSETGTSQLPSPAGLVIRRINSTSFATNQIVARNDKVTLERDGSNGGMIIRYPAGSYRQAIACSAIMSNGALIGYYNTLVSPAVAGTLQVVSATNNVVQFHCTFGDTFEVGHHTEVNLIREGSDYFWVGTLTSTYNQ